MLRLFLLVFLVVFIGARGCKEEPTKFRSDYKYVAAINGWLKLHRAPTDLFDARARCQLEGADLASPSDEQMLRAMSSIIGQSPGAHCGVYTGIHAWFSKGDYTSIEGTPLSQMPVDFADTESCPRTTTHPCTVLLPSGLIDTVECRLLFPFVCYRKNKERIHHMCECGTIDPEYKYNETTGHCYKFHLQPQNWQDAYKVCLAEGGYLAIINSAEEAKVIWNIFEQHPIDIMVAKYKSTVLLGFKVLKGTWSTIHGQSLQDAGYASWYPGEPTYSVYPDGKRESCGAMFRQRFLSKGLLADVLCEYEYAFLCERHPTDENSNDGGALNIEAIS